MGTANLIGSWERNFDDITIEDLDTMPLIDVLHLSRNAEGDNNFRAFVRREDNYSSSYQYMSGRFSHDEAAQIVIATISTRYIWSAGVGMGYDLHGYERKIYPDSKPHSIHFTLNQNDEYYSLTRQNSIYEQVDNSNGDIHYHIQNAERYVANWHENIHAYVIWAVKRGYDLEDIAANAQLSLRAVQKIKTDNQIRPKSSPQPNSS